MQRCRNCNKIIGVDYYESFCNEACEGEYATFRETGQLSMILTPNDIIDGYEHDRMMNQFGALLKKELNSPPENCHCRSYHSRTGLHAEQCPCYIEDEPINSRFDILDL